MHWRDGKRRDVKATRKTCRTGGTQSGVSGDERRSDASTAKVMIFRGLDNDRHLLPKFRPVESAVASAASVFALNGRPGNVVLTRQSQVLDNS